MLITTNSLHHLITQTTIYSETKTTLKIAEVPWTILQLTNMLGTTKSAL